MGSSIETSNHKITINYRCNRKNPNSDPTDRVSNSTTRYNNCLRDPTQIQRTEYKVPLTGHKIATNGPQNHKIYHGSHRH